MPFDDSTSSDLEPDVLPLPLLLPFEFVEPGIEGMTGVVAQIGPQENITSANQCDFKAPAFLDKPCTRLYCVLAFGRGTQVVRERSAKPLHASSILARASNFSSVRSPQLQSLTLFS